MKQKMMDEQREFTKKEAVEVELKTIDTLLDRGVQVKLPAPLLLRVLGKKSVSIVVKRPDSHKLYEISALYLKMKQTATLLEPETIDEAHQLVFECMKPACRIIAYGVKSNFKPFGWCNRYLAWYICRHMDSRKLAELWTLVVNLCGIHDFCNIIRSMSGMRMTKPKT